MSHWLAPSEVRSLFPAAQRASYLNAAASSPLCAPVEQAAVRHYREALEQGDVGWPGWMKRKEDIRARLAAFINASPDEVAFIGSTSAGFNFVASMLKARGVREVVTLEQEFPSTTVPLLHAGLRLRVVSPRPDGRYPVEDIEAAIGQRTGALALSAVQYSTGFRADLAALGKLCRARKLYFAVNAAQALGQIPIGVRELGIDFLCAPSHKWMMGGYGVGLFYAKAALLEPLPAAGWMSVERPMAMQPFPGAKFSGRGRVKSARGVALKVAAWSLEVGCGPYATLFGLDAALELLERAGISAIEEHNLSLQRVLRARLEEKGFRPLAPLGSGICTVRVEGDPLRAAKALSEKGVVVSPRGGGVRVSTHVFNAEEDVDKLLWAFDALGIRPGPPPAA